MSYGAFQLHESQNFQVDIPDLQSKSAFAWKNMDAWCKPVFEWQVYELHKQLQQLV